MLTQQDLQAIREVVQTEVHRGLKQGLVPVLRRISKIEKDLAVAIHLFDNEHHELEERVQKLETLLQSS